MVSHSNFVGESGSKSWFCHSAAGSELRMVSHSNLVDESGSKSWFCHNAPGSEL